MQEVTITTFQTHLEDSIEQTIATHEPLKVTGPTGLDFILLGASDWSQVQETLFVLQNESLMRQIAESLHSMSAGAGYRPTSVSRNCISRGRNSSFAIHLGRTNRNRSSTPYQSCGQDDYPPKIA
jgi:antitoxin YefM